MVNDRLAGLDTFHDLLLPGVRGRLGDAYLYRVSGELWVGRDDGPRVKLINKDEARQLWSEIRANVTDRLHTAECVLGPRKGE